MTRLITKERAYWLASQWGSFKHELDPGACMYGFYANDGRPVSEVHRAQVLDWLRGRRADTAKDKRELRQLIRFMTDAPLRPEVAR